MDEIDYDERKSIEEGILENNNVDVNNWHINLLEEKNFYKINVLEN